MKINKFEIKTELFLKTLENIPDGVLLADKEANILINNEALGKIMLIGGELPENVKKLIISSAKTKKKIETELTVLYPEKRRLNLTVIPIFESDEVEEILIIAKDISTAYLVDAIRKDFASNASHELKTPVSNLMLIAENIRYAMRNDKEKVENFMELLDKETKRLSRLVNDLLDLSRLEKPLKTRSKINVKSLIESSIADINQDFVEKGLKLSINIERGLKIEGDLKQLQTAIVNLLDNAKTYAPEGGTVKISAARINGNIEIYVEDSGRGIPKKHLNRIFERFYRADEARSRQSGGTGLGLAIVKNTMELHKGSVKVESQIGQGSTFTLVFPVQGEL
jgi:two-component system phosphate regulon sensor histidine kinase PhoR